jgi:hypothetical protein
MAPLITRCSYRNGVGVSYGKQISQLLAGLKRTGSLQAALTDGVRLACEAAGCSASAVVTRLDAACPARYWFCHDPRGLLEQVASEDAVLGTSVVEARNKDGDRSRPKGPLRGVQVPLSCAGRDVGWLILLAPQEASDEEVKTRIAGIDALLAVLMAAAENSAANPLSGVLGREAFHARVASELARSERCGDQLSVLHVKVAVADGAASNEKTGPWAIVALLGEALASRLRASDVIAVMAPDHLAMLLTGAGRLGALIAARRIEQFLRMSGNDFPGMADLSCGSPEFCLRTFPDDGADVDSLCRVHRWSCGAAAPRAAAVSSL